MLSSPQARRGGKRGAARLRPGKFCTAPCTPPHCVLTPFATPSPEFDFLPFPHAPPALQTSRGPQKDYVSHNATRRPSSRRAFPKLPWSFTLNQTPHCRRGAELLLTSPRRHLYFSFSTCDPQCSVQRPLRREIHSGDCSGYPASSAGLGLCQDPGGLGVSLVDDRSPGRCRCHRDHGLRQQWPHRRPPPVAVLPL